MPETLDLWETLFWEWIYDSPLEMCHDAGSLITLSEFATLCEIMLYTEDEDWIVGMICSVCRGLSIIIRRKSAL